MAAPVKTSMYRFKDITTVPDAKDLVDIILSQTQRRTPTQVHPQFKVSRIRSFYMRKVKYCQQAFHDKLTSMLTEFPRLDDIHPFYADLCNVLYDRDHYKLALGQVNTVRGIIDHIAKDYVRLLKYADSPYKCKMLKRAALGRMCTAVRKLSDSLKYLEEVRQHLSRLPSINPNTRTLILTGYPNVGKSSFINAVTNANVEVQPYAFTTKSLYVGHFDYGYTRWQLIDTPGILDHPLANRNTIELTAITALAHIQAAVLFMVDISEQCGFSIESQVALFHSIKALFKSKPLVIVLNKVDVVKYDQLTPEKQQLLREMTHGLDDVIALECSCLCSTGLDDVKNKACEMLLTRRVESKVASHRAESISNRLHVTSVTPPTSRPPNIPATVLQQRTFLKEQPTHMLLAKDIEEAQGGAGVYSADLNNEWQLKIDAWKHDIMPEIFGGKNVLDYIDPDIDEKLRALEQEEAALLQQSIAATEMDDSEWKKTSEMLNKLMGKIQLRRIENRLKKGHNHRIMPRTNKIQETTSMKSQLRETGYDVASDMDVPTHQRGRSLTQESDDSDSVYESGTDDDAMKDDDDDDEVGGHAVNRRPSSTTGRQRVQKKLRTFSRVRTKSITTGGDKLSAVERAKAKIASRITKGLASPALRQQVEKVKRKKDKNLAIQGRAGEADRFIGTKMPKHLFSGKRGVGKTDRR